MALPNNPTPSDVVKAIKDLEAGGGGSSTNVKVDGTSITSNNEADLHTINGDYNASSNKLATANDLPSDYITADDVITSTDVTPLSNYYTKTEANTLLNAKQNVLSTGIGIDISSNIISLNGSLPYLTTAPNAANIDGLKIVVLSSEPATRYSGYIYIITE